MTNEPTPPPYEPVTHLTGLLSAFAVYDEARIHAHGIIRPDRASLFFHLPERLAATANRQVEVGIEDVDSYKLRLPLLRMSGADLESFEAWLRSRRVAPSKLAPGEPDPRD